MRFPSIILGLTLATTIVASPVALEGKRQTSVPATISSIVNTLTTSVGGNLVAINDLVTGVKQNVDASVQVVAAVSANLDAIKDAFITAANSLIAITTGGVGGIAAAASGFTRAQITQLLQDAQTIRTLITNVGFTFALIVTNLAPAALTSVTDEIAAVKNAVAAFTTPLTNFLTAVQNASGSLSFGIFGIGALLTGLANIVTSLLSGLLGL